MPPLLVGLCWYISLQELAGLASLIPSVLSSLAETLTSSSNKTRCFMSLEVSILTANSVQFIPNLQWHQALDYAMATLEWHKVTISMQFMNL